MYKKNLYLENLKSSLPTIEEIEAEIEGIKVI